MRTRKTIALFLAVVLAMTMGLSPAFADDSAPAEVKDTYEYDGVTYVNVGDTNFSTDQTAYYKAMLGNKLANSSVDEDVRDYSVSDIWTQLAFYMAHYNTRSDNVNYFFHYWNRIYSQDDFANARELLLAPDTGELRSGQYTVAYAEHTFDENWNIPTNMMQSMHPNRMPTFWWRDTLESADNGEAMANAVARQAASFVGDLRKEHFPWEEYPVHIDTVEIKNAGDNKLPDEEGPVFYTTLGTASDMYKYWSAREGYEYHTIVVAFSDFNVTPIIPDENEEAPYVYVTSTDGESSSSNVRKTVSDVKNASTLSATASQSVSESTSMTLSSGISGSSSYSESNTKKIGVKVSTGFKFGEVFSLGGDASYEDSNTVTDTVSKGWSKGESVTTSDSETGNITVTLPPYTAVLLSQRRSTEKETATYNCPVSLNFKVTVYYACGDVQGTHKTSIHFNKIAEFGGEDHGSALEDLYERYDNYQVAGTTDRGQISWSDMSGICAGAIGTASSTATFGSTTAKFVNVMDVVKTEVDSVLPIKPIHTIKPVNVAEGSTLTNQSWDYDFDMDEGESEFISNKVKLKALNDVGAEFATFNQGQGHFVVVDENGNEDTGVVEIKKVNGQNKLVAKAEGTAYLKYLINDDIYQTAEMAASNSGEYITNEDIANAGGTAIIQVNVHHKHNLTRHAAKPATCTEDGSITYWTCPCGKYFLDKDGENEIFEDETVVKKTGHSWGEWEVTVEPTETTEGEEARECLNGCGEVQTKPVPVTTHNHKLTRHAPKRATCTEDGTIAYWVCEEGDNPCGKLFSDKNGENEISEDETVDPARGHSWGEWEVTVEPTETTVGEETRECLNGCGEKKTRVVPVLPHKHKMVKTAKKRPTCTEAGNIMYYTCSDCGWVFTDFEGIHEISPDEVVLPATGHKWDAGKVTKKATTKATGTKVYTCTSCGATKTTTLAKLGRSANTLSVKGKTATVKYAKLSKKNRTLKASKVIKFTNKGQGKRTYKLSSAKRGSKSFKKYFKINKTTGKVSVRKDLKKGTYKVKVKVKAAGNANYKPSAVKTVTFKVQVK